MQSVRAGERAVLIHLFPPRLPFLPHPSPTPTPITGKWQLKLRRRQLQRCGGPGDEPEWLGREAEREAIQKIASSLCVPSALVYCRGAAWRGPTQSSRPSRWPWWHGRALTHAMACPVLWRVGRGRQRKEGPDGPMQSWLGPSPPGRACAPLLLCVHAPAMGHSPPAPTPPGCGWVTLRAHWVIGAHGKASPTAHSSLASKTLPFSFRTPLHPLALALSLSSHALPPRPRPRRRRARARRRRLHRLHRQSGPGLHHGLPGPGLRGRVRGGGQEGGRLPPP